MAETAEMKLIRLEISCYIEIGLPMSFCLTGFCFSKAMAHSQRGFYKKRPWMSTTPETGGEAGSAIREEVSGMLGHD